MRSRSVSRGARLSLAPVTLPGGGYIDEVQRRLLDGEADGGFGGEFCGASEWTYRDRSPSETPRWRFRRVGGAIESDVAVESGFVGRCGGLRWIAALRAGGQEHREQECQKSDAEGQVARHAGAIFLRKTIVYPVDAREQDLVWLNNRHWTPGTHPKNKLTLCKRTPHRPRFSVQYPVCFQLVHAFPKARLVFLERTSFHQTAFGLLG